MRQGLALILVGALLGGGAMLLLSGDPLTRIGSDLAGPAGPAPTGVEESLRVYLAAEAVPDAPAVRRELESLAEAAESPVRDVGIDAWLTRYSDLAPAEAAATALNLGLGVGFVADAFVRWAETDADAAIAALAAIPDNAARRSVALALLEVVGDDRAGIGRIARGLPESDRDALTVDWILARAADDPLAAFRDAQSIGSAALRQRAIGQVGEIWAAQDPRGAFAQAERLPADMQSAYRQGVINEWVRFDGTDFLSWLSTVSSPPPEVVVGIGRLAATHSDLVFSIAETAQGNTGRMLRFAAYSALAEADPDAAMARAASLPPGEDREQLLASIAEALVRRDPDAALEWAMQQPTLSQRVMNQLISSIAQSDPERAIELMENPPPGVDPQMITAYLSTATFRDPAQSEALADRLVASDSVQSRTALRSLLSSWMQQAPERAVEWVFAHQETLGAALIGPAAQAMARADPVAAAAYVSRVPEEYRGVWIDQVAGRYAARDVDGALAWVSQFQGEAVYTSALRQIVAASASIDPRRAANLLSGSDAEVQLGAATQVAQAYAQQAPRDAVRWVMTLEEPGTRREALAGAVSVWSLTDMNAARSYTLGLDRGEDRDQALRVLVTRLAQAGDVDRDLLEEISNAAVRQQIEQQLEQQLEQRIEPRIGNF